MEDHQFDRVEQEDGAYVLVCECGWHSHPSPRARFVGEEWDDHRLAGAAT